MSVLAVEKQVFSFVPKGSWTLPGTVGQKDIGLVNVEPYGVPLMRLPTQKPVSSCASNSRTGQTVCTTNDQDVYVFTPPAPNPSTLKSSASGTSSFFGGSCVTCGVTMDAINNNALLSLSLAVPPSNQATSQATSGFQYIDLGPKPKLETAFRSEAPQAFNPGGEISKGMLIDPIRNWILSPNESGNFEIIKVSVQKGNKDDDKDDKDEGKNNKNDKDDKNGKNDKNDKNDKDDKDDGKNSKKDNDRHDDTNNDDHGDKDHGDRADKTQLAFFENNTINDPISQFPASFASAGEDCRTGIALATVEFSDPSEVYIADLTRANFHPGSPGSWQVPANAQTVQTLAGSSFPGFGPNGIAVAQGTSIGLLAGMNPSDSITAFKLAALSGPGTTPAIADWVTCRLPDHTGNAPHTLNAYQSPNSGHAMAVVGNLGATTLWRVDLTQMLNLPRTAHICDSVFLPPAVLRSIVVP